MPAAPRVVDLRSDTFTQPTDEMRDAMRNAEVGDDVFGEDLTVNALEALAADRLGKEAGLFVPSGTMGNQVAVFTHTKRRGDLVLEQEAHILIYECGAASLFSGVTMRPLPGERGVFSAAQLGEVIQAGDLHAPPTTLVALENTHNRASGTVWAPSQTRAVARMAHDHGIPVHVDGARVFNSAVAQNLQAADLVRDVDSVMFCLSKGLSAPVGSMLCGTREFIERARFARKAFGGGMRQAGVLAAAGLVALRTMTERLADDHANARRLAAGLAKLPGIRVDLDAVQTNIVVFNVDETRRTAPDFCRELSERGVKALWEDSHRARFVTHRHIRRGDVDFALARLGEMLEAAKPLAKSRRRTTS